jgi:hypothetical protein
MGLQNNHEEIPQIHTLPACLRKRGSGACRVHHPSLYIAQATRTTDEESEAQRLAELQELKETRFLADFHRLVEKGRQKSWHDRHIKTKVFIQGDKVLLYDNRYQEHPGKLRMHWLGPFIVAEIRPLGAVRLVQLVGVLRPGWVNGARLKPYLSRN